MAMSPTEWGRTVLEEHKEELNLDDPADVDLLYKWAQAAEARIKELEAELYEDRRPVRSRRDQV